VSVSATAATRMIVPERLLTKPSFVIVGTTSERSSRRHRQL
jgi:hypothetical protein